MQQLANIAMGDNDDTFSWAALVVMPKDANDAL
jgi:hypothetical protein